jgi:hypothetical protein
MNDYSLDPETVRQAKELAAGPLGREIARLPLRYAVPVFFGEPPGNKRELITSSGTVSLVDLGNGPMAVTCSHVLDGYRQRAKEDPRTIFQIGNLKLNPLEIIIDESEQLDLVTIDLRGKKIDEIASGRETVSYFFHPRHWPPQDIIEGDVVAFGGFPGIWRQRSSADEFAFVSFSSGASFVTSVRDEYFVCQLEREHWIEPQEHYLRPLDVGTNPKDLYDFGGLSGGPVIIVREVYWDFVGIIYQFSSEFDLLYIRPTKFISESGSISTP